MTDTTARIDASRDKLKGLSLKAGEGGSKLGAEKLMPEEQRRRFEDLAREAGCRDLAGTVRSSARCAG